MERKARVDHRMVRCPVGEEIAPKQESACLRGKTETERAEVRLSAFVRRCQEEKERPRPLAGGVIAPAAGVEVVVEPTAKRVPRRLPELETLRVGGKALYQSVLE